jgi:phage terminase large subunit-like protein
VTAAQAATRGDVAAAWIERNLVHGEGDRFGEPFRLAEFQRDLLRKLYAIDPSTGRRRYRRAVVLMPKGNGKTELAAALAVLSLGGPLAPKAPNVPIAAASFEQADLVFGTARTMISQGPLAPYFEVFDTEILRRDGPGRMYRVAAIAGTNDGGRPTDFFADELHEWVGSRERVHLVIANGLSKRADGFELSISTPGTERDSLLGRLYEYGQRIAAGEFDDPSFLFVNYEASSTWDLTDPEQLREAIVEANPAAGAFLSVDNLLARFREIPEHEFRRYHLGQWVSSPDHWIASEDWALCARPGSPPAAGTPVVLGFDGSVRRDCTGLVGCTIGPPRHLFVVEAWEPDGTPVPRQAVDAKLAEAMRTWDVQELACDPNGWREDVERWSAEYGPERVLAYEMNPARTAPASDALRTAVKAAVEGVDPLPLTHDGDPRLARHVANARPKPTRWGEYIAKEHRDSPNRIDLAMAAVIAADRAHAVATRPPPVLVQFFTGSDDDD